MKCGKSLSPLNATSFTPLVCTRQAVEGPASGCDTPVLQTFAERDPGTSQRRIASSAAIGEQSSVAARTSAWPPIEQQASSSSQTAGVTLPHPKHGETWSVSSMGTSGPGGYHPPTASLSSDPFRGLQPTIIFSECSDTVYTMCFLLAQ